MACDKCLQKGITEQEANQLIDDRGCGPGDRENPTACAVLLRKHFQDKAKDTTQEQAAEKVIQ